MWVEVWKLCKINQSILKVNLSFATSFLSPHPHQLHHPNFSKRDSKFHAKARRGSYILIFSSSSTKIDDIKSIWTTQNSSFLSVGTIWYMCEASERREKNGEKCQSNFSSYLCVRQHDDDEFIDKRWYQWWGCDREKNCVIGCKNDANIQICCIHDELRALSFPPFLYTRWRRLSMHDIFAHDIRHNEWSRDTRVRDHRHWIINKLLERWMVDVSLYYELIHVFRGESRTWTCMCIEWQNMENKNFKFYIVSSRFIQDSRQSSPTNSGAHVVNSGKWIFFSFEYFSSLSLVKMLWFTVCAFVVFIFHLAAVFYSKHII